MHLIAVLGAQNVQYADHGEIDITNMLIIFQLHPFIMDMQHVLNSFVLQVLNIIIIVNVYQTLNFQIES